MILFREEYVAPILAMTKTQTRRTGRRRWNVGVVHQCRTRMLDKSSTFAGVVIRDVRLEPLRGLTQRDAVAEGYLTVSEYFAAFERIYGTATYMRALDEPLWVVEFALMCCHELPAVQP
jgi:hypothetical protein